ncbi:MAG TPA: hypothetical protein DGU37_05495 [Microbacterium sp.]|nr:hypothetical protein [Microbacterium sp.]
MAKAIRWEVIGRASEPTELVRLGDRLVPNDVTVTLRQGGETAAGRRRPAAVARFAVRDGVIECVEFHVVVAPDDRGIRNEDLVLVDLERLAREAFDYWAAPIESDEDGDVRGGTLGAAVESLGPSRDLAGRVSRGRGYPVELIRRAARLYLDPRPEVRSRPAAHVVDETGEDRRTVNRWIAEARERGLVPPHPATDEDMTAAYLRLVEGESNGEAR